MVGTAGRAKFSSQVRRLKEKKEALLESHKPWIIVHLLPGPASSKPHCSGEYPHEDPGSTP